MSGSFFRKPSRKPMPRLAENCEKFGGASLSRRAGFQGSAAHFAVEAFHRALKLLECAHFDLAHAFARYAVFLAQILKRRRVIFQPPLGEDRKSTRLNSSH